MDPSAINENKKIAPGCYDVGIIGGGLAGLSLSILLAKEGYKVVLFEKEKYPFHRVCGEYISLESWKFIEGLDLHLSKLHLPVIKKLMVSSANGHLIESNLDLGGFGISRYFIDNELKNIAIEKGVYILEQVKVKNVIYKGENFLIEYNGGIAQCLVAAGCFGKRSNLDVTWSRKFVRQKPGKLNNYIGVKYHIKISPGTDIISLHNFKDGYCGISKIEDEKYCLCYLTTAQNLKANNNSIREMEQNVLYKNPFLKKIFTTAQFLFPEPVTISQISFDKKQSVENHVMMVGDAAGMITPLCGNGMSMALHSSKIAFNCMHGFLKHDITRSQMEIKYEKQWNRHFEKRLKVGRFIQKLFGKKRTTDLFINFMKYFPFLVNKMIKATHGKEF